MADINITQKDLDDAQNFITEYLTEQVTEADFSVGSAVRDLLVKGFAYLYAYLRGEIDRVTARQSLMRIQSELTDADDIAQSVDELLSNWFVTRKDGLYARMVARFHFSERRAVSIPLASKFWRTTSIIFYIDSETDPYVISEDTLLPTYDSRGVLVDYVAEVPLIAAATGSNYVVDPGRFVQVQVTGGGLQYLSYVEHVEKSTGGENVESSDALIERAGTAITVRNLINNRSCDAVLQAEFPSITDTLTIGMGDPEMIRDRRIELSPSVDLHIGGYYDTYVDLPLTTVEENLTVGGYFARPDNIVNVFRDPYLTHDLGQTFTILGVEAGHVIYIREGIIGSPRGYTITKVSAHELEVSINSPFTEASDELDTNAVRYSIGWLSPGFEEIDFGGGVYERVAAVSLLGAYEDIPYGTSRHIQASGYAVLDGRPVQQVIQVEITDPSTGDTTIDPSTGTVVFRTRVNGTPDNATARSTSDPTATQYQLVVTNPECSQSMFGLTEIYLGDSYYDGKNLKVSYQTPYSFSTVHAYVRETSRRVSAANHLIRTRHPVLLTFIVEYRLKSSSSDTFDATDAAEKLAAHINSFPVNDLLDASDISAFLRTNYDVLGTVFPFTDTNPLYYTLQAPDGQQVNYQTTDVVSIHLDSGVSLVDPLTLTPPANLQARGITTISTASDLRDWFNYAGISDRTIKYRTVASLITFVLKD